MEDAGASSSKLFADFGVMTTTAANGPALTRALLATLASDKPDVIVMELGDGLLGTYGVDAILADDWVRKALTSVVLCANDPVAAWGGVKILREQYELEPAVVTGPATDNAVGTDLIREQLDVAAFNALTQAVSLGDCVFASLGKTT